MSDPVTPSVLSGYRLMWMMVMFDLPVMTPQERKTATLFRLRLLDLGFERVQYSVYVRFCPSLSRLETLMGKLGCLVPDDGRVSILAFTDKQYERIVTYHGNARQPGRSPPDQLVLF